jgi:hypothetical protein
MGLMKMDYFKDVYLKRLNLYGDDMRSRIVGEKIHEFDELFMKQTIYQVLVHQINDECSHIVASLQPNKWNESQELSNLLISRKEKQLKTGDMLKIYQKIGDKEVDKIYLILFHEDNITLGYYCYKLVLLDDVIMLTNEYGDTLHTIPVKITNNSTFTKESFNLNNGGYRGPNRSLTCVTRDFDFFKKGTYFLHKDKGWEIAEKDNISIENVVYLSLGESLKEEYEPRSSEDILVGDDMNFFLNNR